MGCSPWGRKESDMTELMRLFSSDRVMGMMDALGLDEDTPIDAKILSGAVENAQKSVESRNFRSRKNVLEYDNVMNTQREVIYAQRQKVLDGEDLRENMMHMLRSVVDSTVAEILSRTGGVADAAISEEVYKRFAGVYIPKNGYTLPAGEVSQEELANTIFDQAVAVYDAKEKRYTPTVMRELERVVMLRVVDEYWMDNIDGHAV